MQRFRKVLRLSPADYLLLWEALATVALLRIGLWILPFKTLRRMVDARASRRAIWPQSRAVDARKVGWAVRNVSRLVPAASCLTQALAARLLLGQRGIEATLHIGVAREKGRNFEAHAWVTSSGRFVVGGAGAEKFTPLLVLENISG